VGRTGFGNVEKPAAGHALLRRIADLDGDRAAQSTPASSNYAALLAACAQESTGEDSVLGALGRAAAAWISGRDVKRLRSMLLAILGELD
jgi:hypothetical protein